MWDFGFPGISKRNAAIMMMVNGKSYADIGNALGVGKSTITKYKKFAIDKEWAVDEDNRLMLTKLGETILNDNKNEF
jgi:predicted transcriptional regulator